MLSVIVFSVLFILSSSSVHGDQCIEAQEKLSVLPASECNDILTSGNIFNLDDSKIKSYCDADCSTVLNTAYQAIAVACGGGGGGDPTDFYATLMKEACWTYNNTRCLTLWKMYIYPLETGVPSNFTTTYELCGQDYLRSRTNCTDHCKTALKKIIDETGCCYDAIEKIGTPFLGADMIRQCGYSVPSCSPNKDKRETKK